MSSNEPPRLGKCPDCGHVVSKAADACPNCGAVFKKKQPTSGCALGCIALLLVFFVLYVIGTCLPDSQKTPQQAQARREKRETEERARYGGLTSLERATVIVVARGFVKDHLKAPGSAKFSSSWAPEEQVVKYEDGCIVKGWVDAQNAFGALLRNDYIVQLRKTGDGTEVDDWELVEIGIGD